MFNESQHDKSKFLIFGVSIDLDWLGQMLVCNFKPTCVNSPWRDCISTCIYLP